MKNALMHDSKLTFNCSYKIYNYDHNSYQSR